MKLILKKILSHFIHIILLIINKLPILKNFSLFEIDTTRIGHMTHQAEIFYRESKKSITYFIFFEKISNTYFLKLFLKKIKKEKKIILLSYGFFWKRICNIYYNVMQKDLQTTIRNVRKKSSTFLNDNIPFLSIPEKDLEKGYEILEKFGIKKNDKWICVHNRDEAYLKRYYKSFDTSYHNYRNFPIKDLEKAILLFVKKKYFVIRVGSESTGELKISSDRYFDYSRSNIKSDFMDCFILSRCEMFFGANSGMSTLAASFRKPNFLINTAPLESVFSVKRTYPGIFKRLTDIKTNKVLTISEMIKRDVCNFFSEEEFRLNNVRNINNTEDEIEEFALESLNIIENKNTLKSEDQKLKQNLFEIEIKKDPLIKDLDHQNPIGLKFLEETLIN